MAKHLFYISQGVEVRYFLLSGLTDLLKANSEVALLIDENNDSPILKKYIKQFDIETIVLPLQQFNINIWKYESYIRTMRNARKRVDNSPIFKHFGGNANQSKWYDKLLGNRISSKIFEKAFRFFLRRHYKNNGLQQFLKDNNTSAIHFVENGWKYHVSLGINSNLLNIPVHLHVNSLKTFFVNDFVFFNVNKFYAWNQSQQKLFAHSNSGISDDAFINAGSLYHNFLMTTPTESEIQLLKGKYQIASDKKIILYSLIFEKVYESEYILLKQIDEYLSQNFDESHRPIVVVRRNPFEESQLHIDEIRKCKNVVVADHYWERNAEKSWSIQDLEGENEWRIFLNMAICSLNITSMSTVDSIVCGTPVLNIGFDTSGNYNQQLDFLIKSPFANEFEKSRFVETAKTFEEFKMQISRFMNIKDHTQRTEVQHSLEITLPMLNSFA